LKLLTAEEEPTEGTIILDGEDITSVESQDLSQLRRKIGTIFQDFKLLPQKTAVENIAFAMEVAGKESAEIEKNVPQILALVGLADREEAYPSQLSAGEKQRVSIARALINQPKILMADEPTGNLDLLNTWDIIQLLLKINQLGTTVILSTHDKDTVDALNKRVVTLDKGRLIRDQLKGKYVL
ncbi:MAG TPA: ATP-binding cassette domain-containing protein, partial [Candidatus Portnoybacteria bacterium]|nr:ATP-binding cassette domain-containing protein [Candidatus Portnoybacteria bacterium]